VLRETDPRVTLWEALLPEQAKRLPAELQAVDAYLDDERFVAPFRALFDRRLGRPSVPIDTLLRLLYLKHRYQLGYESLCREVTDSISWRRFCRLPLDRPAPHPTTLVKLVGRAGPEVVDELNARAAGQARPGQAAAGTEVAGGYHGGGGRHRLPTDADQMTRRAATTAAIGTRTTPKVTPSGSSRTPRLSARTRPATTPTVMATGRVRTPRPSARMRPATTPRVTFGAIEPSWTNRAGSAAGGAGSELPRHLGGLPTKQVITLDEPSPLIALVTIVATPEPPRLADRASGCPVIWNTSWPGRDRLAVPHRADRVAMAHRPGVSCSLCPVVGGRLGGCVDRLNTCS
jgi:Transposase domain (DUF772)